MRSILSLAIVLLATAPAAYGQVAATRPSILNQITIDQKLGDSVPLDTGFRDEAGEEIALRSCFHGKPVVIVPVYYECPMLCSVTLNQFTRTLNAMTENVGEQFDVVTVSFDPRETADLAAAKKRSYLKSYRRNSAETGWHFLTGSKSSLEELMKAIGFHYEWDEKNQQFAHAAVIIVVSPEGKISRYFLGIDYPPVLLQAALKDAGMGKVGQRAESIFLYCFKYDPNTGKYGLVIDRSIKALGALTVIGLVSLIGSLHIVRVRKERLIGLNGIPPEGR